MKNWISRLRRDEKGATAIEYALVAALIAIAIAGTPLSDGVLNSWNNVGSEVSTAFK